MDSVFGLEQFIILSKVKRRSYSCVGCRKLLNVWSEAQTTEMKLLEALSIINCGGLKQNKYSSIFEG